MCKSIFCPATCPLCLQCCGCLHHAFHRRLMLILQPPLLTLLLPPLVLLGVPFGHTVQRQRVQPVGGLPAQAALPRGVHRLPANTPGALRVPHWRPGALQGGPALLRNPQPGAWPGNACGLRMAHTVQQCLCHDLTLQLRSPQLRDSSWPSAASQGMRYLCFEQGRASGVHCHKQQASAAPMLPCADGVLCAARVCCIQVMGDKGFIEKTFQLMKDTMEADKERANREADEQEGGDGTDEVPGARKKRGGRSRGGFVIS